MSRVIRHEQVRLVSSLAPVEGDAGPDSRSVAVEPSDNGASARNGLQQGAGRSGRPAAILEAARIVADARVKAARLEEEAAQHAREIVAAAESRADEIRREAEDAGYAAGVSAGKDVAQAELTELFTPVRQIVEEAQRLRESALDHVRDDTVKLALAVAEKLVRRELEIDPNLAVRVAAAAVRKAVGAKRLIIRMNPQDLPVARDHLERLHQVAGEAELREDTSILPGGCVIETEHGVVDGRLETRLVEVGRALLDVMSDGE